MSHISLLSKAKVLTDGLGLIGLIYKLSGHNFSFSLKWRVKMEDSDSDNELLKDPFSAGERKEFTPKKVEYEHFRNKLSETRAAEI